MSSRSRRVVALATGAALAGLAAVVAVAHAAPPLPSAAPVLTPPPISTSKLEIARVQTGKLPPLKTATAASRPPPPTKLTAAQPLTAAQAEAILRTRGLPFKMPSDQSPDQATLGPTQLAVPGFAMHATGVVSGMSADPAIVGPPHILADQVVLQIDVFAGKRYLLDFDVTSQCAVYGTGCTPNAAESYTVHTGNSSQQHTVRAGAHGHVLVVAEAADTGKLYVVMWMTEQAKINDAYGYVPRPEMQSFVNAVRLSKLQ